MALKREPPARELPDARQKRVRNPPEIPVEWLIGEEVNW
jgi:hypothetical protein